ncbi:uncharacterized protein LOC123662799 [Melitaea cinxia]|uniref:uncharacterized protein LOC123662799 n=1 Tax=Melitaea cinxia TaxID=113334 RepID=UPI001E270A1C|nr:uncharacterized protein LOC123662799 [Melitaea cinxia]
MFIILLMLLPLFDAAYIISLYGDVYKDVEFFTRTFPWIIDNIGGEISVDYYMQGSGRYSVPHMCALNELKLNTFLQAQYLKCEAEGKPSESCLCEAGVDPQKYKHCVLSRGSYASLSASKYNQLSIDASPIIELGYRNTVFGVEDSWYLKKICTIFGDNQPRGCRKPFACNSTEFENEKRGIVNFKCPECYNLNMKLKVDQDELNVTTTTTTTSTTPFYK